MEAGKLKRSYENKGVTWIEESKKFFNPAKRPHDLLSDENFDKLGQMGSYNYMDDKEFRNMIRTKLFTDQDYKSLIKLRQQSGGVRGAACEGSVVAPAPGN